MKIARTVLFAAFFAALFPGASWAWGEKGHETINRVAAKSFGAELPPFLRTPQAVEEIAYLGPEMDRIKGAGTSWDADEDPAHYVDLLDDGTIAGAVNVSSMPPNRESYDSALRAARTDQYRQGYLPYAILDGWEQLREDFAYWRADDYAAAHDADAALRTQASTERDIMQRVTVQDLGVWAHFIGDGSQPLHVTVHFNGWGNYPNPRNFTQSRRTHSEFESDFVDRYVSEAQVEALMKPESSLAPPAALLPQSDVMSAIVKYLETSNRAVTPLYEIEKSGGFQSGTPEAVRFTASRLAAGAMALRDFTRWAWQDSAFASVGYPEIPVSDIVSGKARWPQSSDE